MIFFLKDVCKHYPIYSLKLCKFMGFSFTVWVFSEKLGNLSFSVFRSRPRLPVIHPVCPLNMSCGVLVAETMDSISLNSTELCCFPKETNLSEHTAHVTYQSCFTHRPFQSASAARPFQRSLYDENHESKRFLYFFMLFLSNKNPCL